MDASALLPNVPDAPQLVEARGMLLSGDGVVLWSDVLTAGGDMRGGNARGVLLCRLGNRDVMGRVDRHARVMAPWRSRGYARAAPTALLATMRSRGTRGVWGALASNEPSLRLAARLGFSPVSRVWILTRSD